MHNSAYERHTWGTRRLVLFAVRHGAPWLLAVGAVAGAHSADSQEPARPTGTAQNPGWRQWGGPARNFVVSGARVAETWPETGPRVLWSRPLGVGHSAILVDDGRLYTMYRAGDGRSRRGPWASEESVVALDAADGKPIWEHKYASKAEDFGYGAGPHSTPLIVGDRLFAAGTNKQLFAFDKRSGRVLWSFDLVQDLGAPSLLIRPIVKAGYGCSPIAYRDTVICSVGGPGQSVVAFRQSDGAVVWKSGHFLVSEVAPILIRVGGQEQLVVVGGGTINGLDPATGRVLWSHPHDPGNDLNCLTPIWGDDHILFVSSAYKAGSRALRLTREGDATRVEELWFTNRVRFMFLSAVRVGDHIYGTSGDLGPQFLTALDLKTGQSAWQHRGFARSSLLYADNKGIILEEDGDLTIAKLDPAGVTVLAQARIFGTTAWTVPTLVGSTLYARDREKIVALDLAPASGTPQRGGARAAAPAPPPQRGAGPERPEMSRSRPDPSSGFAGTWALDRARSQINPEAGLFGLGAAGAPATLHITQAANGTVVIESQMNESHARYYPAGRTSTTPAGEGASVTMRSSLEGRTLTGEGTRDPGAGGVAVPIREVHTLSPDGEVLTITITAGSQSGTLVYTRIQSVGSCKSWPTPCKF